MALLGSVLPLYLQRGSWRREPLVPLVLVVDLDLVPILHSKSHMGRGWYEAHTDSREFLDCLHFWSQKIGADWSAHPLAPLHAEQSLPKGHFHLLSTISSSF
jgi:hypothetical protein